MTAIANYLGCVIASPGSAGSFFGPQLESAPLACQGFAGVNFV